MEEKVNFSLSYEELMRVCVDAIHDHIGRARSQEGLGLVIEQTKAYAIVEVWSLLAAAGNTLPSLIEADRMYLLFLISEKSNAGVH